MSSPFSFEHLADIGDGVRRMVERTRAHKDDLNQLVETAEGVARQATVLAVALTRDDTNADGLSRLLVRRHRVKAIGAGHRARGCSARSQSVAMAHPMSRWP